MKCWAISDTHGMHGQLKVPEGIDIVLCAGDISNSKNRAINSNEVMNFLTWWDKLNIDIKILIAGNHDTSIESGLVKPNDFTKTSSYLEHEQFMVSWYDGREIKIFGSPYTPTFGDGWAFNKNRGKLDSYWKEMPNNLDILITHGPPKSILDLSENRDGILEQCGDTALYNHVLEKKPRFHMFGHIHNFKTCRNQGTFMHEGITFINASCVEDGRFDRGLTSNGVIFEL